MLTKGSLQLGELFYGKELKQPTDLLQGLVNVSLSTISYTDNYKEEVEEATQENDHTLILSELSTRLAEIFRQSLNEIKAYGIPFAKRVATSIFDEIYVDTVPSNLYIHYIDVSNPFFDSPIYPSKVKDESMTWTNIDLSVINQLEFNTEVSGNEISQFVNSKHPDVVKLLKAVVSGQAIGYFFTKTGIEDLFRGSINNINFGKVNNQITPVETILSLYTVVTKMFVSEDPAPWLVKGSLQDYRAFVNLLYNGMTKQLINLRQYCKAQAARKLVVVPISEPSLLGDGSFGGEIVVFHTREVLNDAIRNSVNLREAISGGVVARLKGEAEGAGCVPNDLLNNLYTYVRKYNNYKENFTRVRLEKAKQNALPLVVNSIVRFVTERPALNKTLSDKANAVGVLLNTFVVSNLNTELNTVLYKTLPLVKDGSDNYEAALEVILQSNLVENFMRLLGNTLAADIIKQTTVTVEEDHLVDQRERLTVAVVNTLVGLCFKE